MEKNREEKVEHVLKEGSRNHVLSYSDRGVHCNVCNCEVNSKVDSGGENRSKLVVGTSKKNPPLLREES